MRRPVTGRLAPTPSGDLHLGNAVAFGAAWLSVRSQGGTLLLRIEDTDRTRYRQAVEDGQRRDLEWLGLTWDEEVTRQSERDYQPWLDRLASTTYRCTCTRRQIREAGGVYPGTCRTAGHLEGALRYRLSSTSVDFVDRRWGLRQVDPSVYGDPVLYRKDGIIAYNLAVVVDDFIDGVTEVVRGADLLDYTAVQVRLWQCLGATPPTWMHAPLILGPDGKKLSKSHGSSHVGMLRAAGWRRRDVWRLVLPWLGIEDCDDLEEAVAHFDPTAGPRGPIQVDSETLEPTLGPPQG